MRNDIKKIDNVTKEMEVNNELYYDMLDELFDSVFDFYYYTAEEDMMDIFEVLYFKRRILSVMEKNDIPFKAAIGLFFHKDRLDLLCKYREEYLDDEDSDADVYKFILELGYRFYDLISYLGDNEEKVYEMVKLHRKLEFEEKKVPDLSRCIS